MINDLYKLCFQNYRVSLIYVVNRSILGVRGGGGGENQPSEQPSLQHLAVMVKKNIFRQNFS